MRYAVTGATGFVGGALVSQLRATGHDVAALVRRPSAAERLRNHGVELVAGDLDDHAALDRLCGDVDGLFHVAGWYKLGERDPSVGERVNVDGTRNVLDAARRNAVPRTVYTSTLAVNSDTDGRTVDESYRFRGRHISHYDRTKAAAHEVAEGFAGAGLPLVMVQPGVVYGPGDTARTGELLAQVARGGRPLAPRGGGYCWAHVADVAAGHVSAMDLGRPGESYMLAGPQASLAEVLRLTARIAGTEGPLLVPAPMLRATAAVTSVLGRVLPLPSDYQAETLRAALSTYYGTPAKAERELGWRARPLEQGLRETVQQIDR
jgi:nucleoside-diphosphate-sugar epimerase